MWSIYFSQQYILKKTALQIGLSETNMDFLIYSSCNRPSNSTSKGCLLTGKVGCQYISEQQDETFKTVLMISIVFKINTAVSDSTLGRMCLWFRFTWLDYLFCALFDLRIYSNDTFSQQATGFSMHISSSEFEVSQQCLHASLHKTNEINIRLEKHLAENWISNRTRNNQVQLSVIWLKYD